MAILMLLLGMVSAIVIVVFALQNGRVVTVSFFDWSVEASLVLVIMITALMGFLTALFFELFVQIKLRFRLYKMGIFYSFIHISNNLFSSTKRFSF